MKHYRTYIHHYKSRSLDTWIQRRCIICQRFLSLKQIKYCSRCAEKVKINNSINHNKITRKTREGKEVFKKYYRKYRESDKGKYYYGLKIKIYHDADKYNVGDYV